MNVFGLEICATTETTNSRSASDPERKASKREIIWLLYQHRYSREDALQLLRFIDWMLRLPRTLDLEQGKATGAAPRRDAHNRGGAPLPPVVRLDQPMIEA